MRDYFPGRRLGRSGIEIAEPNKAGAEPNPAPARTKMEHRFYVFFDRFRAPAFCWFLARPPASSAAVIVGCRARTRCRLLAVTMRPQLGVLQNKSASVGAFAPLEDNDEVFGEETSIQRSTAAAAHQDVGRIERLRRCVPQRARKQPLMSSYFQLDSLGAKRSTGIMLPYACGCFI